MAGLIASKEEMAEIEEMAEKKQINDTPTFKADLQAVLNMLLFTCTL